MNIQLDADTCVYLLNNKPESVRKRFDSLPLGTAAVSAVVVAELRYGVSKSKSKEKNTAALEALLPSLRIVPFDNAAAKAYGGIRAELERKGTPIGSLDTLIAAHAVSMNATLVTNNLREFKRVPGLHCVSWA